jgi:hypothetical protein
VAAAVSGAAVIAYYTGVRPGDPAGHHCYTPGFGFRDYGRRPLSPWADPADAYTNPNPYPLGDGSVLDNPEVHAQGGRSGGRREEPEGIGRVRQKDGWTLLSMFDRSADGRAGSHASFAFHALLTGPETVEAARRLFPGVIERIEKHLGRPIQLDDPFAPKLPTTSAMRAHPEEAW